MAYTFTELVAPTVQRDGWDRGKSGVPDGRDQRCVLGEMPMGRGSGRGPFDPVLKNRYVHTLMLPVRTGVQRFISTIHGYVGPEGLLAKAVAVIGLLC